MSFAWRDLSITRDVDEEGHSTGGFTAQITYRYPKENQDDPEMRIHRLIRPVRSASTIASLPFSASYRLLALALRWGYLKDYETGERLFRDDRRDILLKPEVLRLPIFLKGQRRGLEIGAGTASGSLPRRVRRQKILAIEYKLYNRLHSGRLEGSRNCWLKKRMDR